MKGLAFLIDSIEYFYSILCFSHSNSETNNHEIHRLQQKLSQNEDERALLRERLDEVELEFGKLLEGRALTLTMYEEQLQSLVQERNALVEQHILESTEK